MQRTERGRTLGGQVVRVDSLEQGARRHVVAALHQPTHLLHERTDGLPLLRHGRRLRLEQHLAAALLDELDAGSGNVERLTHEAGELVPVVQRPLLDLNVGQLGEVGHGWPDVHAFDGASLEVPVDPLLTQARPQTLEDAVTHVGCVLARVLEATLLSDSVELTHDVEVVDGRVEVSDVVEGASQLLVNPLALAALEELHERLVGHARQEVVLTELVNDQASLEQLIESVIERLTHRPPVAGHRPHDRTALLRCLPERPDVRVSDDVSEFLLRQLVHLHLRPAEALGDVGEHLLRRLERLRCSVSRSLHSGGRTQLLQVAHRLLRVVEQLLRSLPCRGQHLVVLDGGAVELTHHLSGSGNKVSGLRPGRIQQVCLQAVDGLT